MPERGLAVARSRCIYLQALLPELAALAGKVGLIRVVLVDYAGFEPVQRLVAAAVVDGTPIDPSLAAQTRAHAGDRWSGIQGSRGCAMAR